MYERSYAETYTMRSTFYRLLGEAGKLLALAYTQADQGNRDAMKELTFDAMVHALAEFEHQDLDGNYV